LRKKKKKADKSKVVTKKVRELRKRVMQDHDYFMNSTRAAARHINGGFLLPASGTGYC